MRKIEEIDSNFKLASGTEKKDVKFYDVLSEPFRVYGVYHDKGMFRRMDENASKSVSEGVYELHFHTAGGRVRFKTDSKYIVLSSEMNHVYKMSHFPLTGSCGFDMYEKEDGVYYYSHTFTPPFDLEEDYTSEFEFPDKKMRDITINFPLYTGVTSLYIGLQKTASLTEAPEYENKKKICYYGSSITQGGCASKPGMAYQSIISRRFDCDFLNLGFSGNAKGEKEMADYISSLSMDVFVCDYDYNAPTPEHLQNTHESFFLTIRAQHPQIPVVFLTRPKARPAKEDKLRAEIIKKTYENAVASGDKNVYYINGSHLMRYAFSDGTVDGCHPTDLGFSSMAQVLGDFFEKENIL